jgi:gamma-glutamyl-gamma-aminobutyrate hydrolase PuuD
VSLVGAHRQRPLVGVTAGSTDVTILEGRLPAFYCGRPNARAIVRAGGDPVILGSLPEFDDDAAERYAELLDAVVLAGGVDISPSLYGGDTEEPDTVDNARDRFELDLIEAMRERGKPILGICRGMQMLTVAFGGSIVDGVHHSVAPGPMAGFHSVVHHRVTLARGSLAATVYRADEIEVACLHHQGPGRVPDGLAVSARTTDGAVEAVEGDREQGFLLGVLWHPEYTFERDELHLRPYQALLAAVHVSGS